MPRTLGPITRVLTLILLLPFDLAGQQVGDSRLGETLVSRLRQQEGKRVRVVTTGKQTHTGRLATVGQDTLRIVTRVGAGADSVAIAITAVDSLWTGKRSAGRGAKIGAITLGLAGGITLGLAIGGVVGALCETDDCEGVKAGLLGGVVTGAGSAIVGAGLGALIGSAVTQWSPVYPASPAGKR